MLCQSLASKRLNLHDDLCLIYPPVISFDILLYGSDEFNDNKWRNSSPYYTKQGWRHWASRGGAWPSNFLCSKNKKGKQREKRKSFKVETIKRLSPRWKCVYCLILESLEFKYYSVLHGPSTLKSISPAPPNLVLICAALHRKLICLRCVLGGISSYFLLVVMT